ncbi:MAG: hypothetical protein A2725_03075 [Candidatus Magasanikbacteria bacterium RIFCSPHIGHO2_01_FULL_33_34]|uniref:Uncharacterized protein n=1 Tax=Candidatus Magasanikbacteria bacterium RIFCSPHIGHO2_01_FULL_33_34 TaxID=1798671 RepID=A0A1F6LH89_9BACT|nr:MAG: hypothetical protein A2725_03075 [Candidatus Magasanikbacteria bacterium RIFCSPHIGHO2_01_FULL_33_34]OGH66114.1 MAG: hypothetical protein A3B83_00565 [Candidatus Magasanikbacteria bacterium RIFCSPHIGHO2_02_FULL_33_17]OGH75960.1 MAG: hypothetical protein A3A89_00475 [Candidatus Magasanikbacteria bacterium RIFCSPLOWO2_01_FULL_33_34]
MTKDATEKFIEINKKFVNNKERLLKFPPRAVRMYEQFAQGRCFCGEKLIVNSFVKTGSGADWLFECGHKITAIDLKETEKQNPSHGDKHYRSELVNNKQGKVRVQTTGEKQGKEESELAVVKLLCHMYKKDLQEFSQPETYSHIDVIGEDDAGNKLYFQVTQLYDQNFWYNLGKNKKASVELEDRVTMLIEYAINRKLNYPKDLRKNLVLVIDSGVGILKTDIDTSHFSNLVTESNFSEIWLVGRTGDLTIKLYPYK